MGFYMLFEFLHLTLQMFGNFSINICKHFLPVRLEFLLGEIDLVQNLFTYILNKGSLFIFIKPTLLQHKVFQFKNWMLNCIPYFNFISRTISCWIIWCRMVTNTKYNKDHIKWKLEENHQLASLPIGHGFINNRFIFL